MNILIIEDEKETLDFLQQAFKEAGFVVDVADTGNIGSYKARSKDYDIVLLDIGLPGKDGREVITEIRQEGKMMPIIILSVIGEISTKAEALDIGADDYLVKPFSFTELSARVRALLRRPRTLEGDVLHADGLVLDVRTRTAEKDGQTIALSPKEFFLLEYLMRNSGRVVSRIEILEHVWDTNIDPFTNTVDTHVANLRKKLRCGSECDLIRTVSGAGYRFG